MRRIYATRIKEPSNKDADNRHPLVIYSRRQSPASNLVLLVHGVRGHRYGYWGRMPQYLYEDFKNADVGLYFYETALRRIGFFWRSIELDREARVFADVLRQSELRSYSTITIVAHSMGGILAKVAIADLHERREAGVLQQVAGVVLLASPQIGSKRVPAFMKWVSPDARALFPHNELITRTNAVLAANYSGDVSANAGGKQPLPIWAVVAAHDFWVDELSAGIGVVDAQKSTVRGDHSTIKNPEHKTDDSYAFVVSAITECVRYSNMRAANRKVISADVPGELAPLVWNLAAKEFGEEVTPQDEIFRWIERGGIVRAVTVVFRRGDALSRDISGFFDVIPLKESAARDIKSGKLRGFQIRLAHMEEDPTAVRVYYIGAIVGTNFHAKAHMLDALKNRIRDLTAAGAVEFLTRPLTRDGLRLAKRNGFRKLTNEPDMGALFSLDTSVGASLAA